MNLVSNSPRIQELCEGLREYSALDPALYQKYQVHRGLRHADGTGVVAGITRICNVHGYMINEGEVEASKKFVREKSEYDSHPVGSYLKMCKDLKSILATAGNFHNYKLNFNLGEVGTGIAVMIVFAIVVILGVTL